MSDAHWQDVLALEHEAVWWYSLLGGRRPGLRDDARAAFVAHRDTRDDLLARFAHDDIATVGPAAGYGSTQIDDDEAGRERSQDIEARLCAAYLRLAGATSGERRRDAVTALRRTARARLDWGGGPVAFPGLDD